MIATLFAFALASTLLILAPGPDSLLVMRNTLRNGRRAGWVTASGTLSGLLVWAVAAALGLSALLRVSHLGYDILRFAGAGYLIWLGVSSLRLSLRKHASPGTITKSNEPDATASEAGWGQVYLNGLLSNLFNPKIGVFFVSFLPPGTDGTRKGPSLMPGGINLWSGPGRRVRIGPGGAASVRQLPLSGVLLPGLDGGPVLLPRTGAVWLARC